MRAPPIICPLPKNIRFHLSCLHQEQEEEQTQKQLPEREGGRSVSNYRMTGVEGPVISAGTAFAKGTYDCFKPHFDYVYDLDKNYMELINESDDLSEVKRDMKTQIDQNKSAMKMTNQCRNWCLKVRRTELKIEDLKQRYENANKWLCGMCPFLKLRKLSISVIDTRKDVVKLKTDMNELKQRDDVMTTRTPPPVATNIVELNSLTNNVQELLNLLGHKDLKRIGIFGMEGVGKTTLLKKLHVEAGQKHRFGNVIFVSYQEKDSVRKIQEDLLRQLKLSEDSVRKIQEDLLRQLKLSMNGSDSTKEVGDRISKLLENRDYLLLLDQVFSCINLHEVGIRDCHKYGKVVFASREKFICTEMDANEYFQVKPLPLEDRMALFQTIVVDVKNDKSMEGIAKQIVKELGGLPLVIKAIAIYLKHRNSELTWQSTLRSLQSISNRQQEYLDDMFDIFELLYDQLHVDMRKCLLYAALFPGGYEIYDDYLVEGWKVLGFTRDVQGGNGQTFGDARIKGNDFLEHLTESYLLVRCLKEKYIKMPELLRKLALKRLYPKEAECQIVVGACEEKEWRDAGRIALMQNRLLSFPKRPKCGKLSTLLCFNPKEAECQIVVEACEEKEWRDAGRIAPMQNRLLSVPKRPKCGKLSTLLLQRNDKLEIIPKSFFARMKKLQILDLYCTGIELLPPSLFSLIDLKALYLNDCRRLAVLSSKIAKLQNLEILDIRDTGIRSLPIEIGKLKNLKCFRVSFPYIDANAESPKNNILHCWKHKKPRVMIPPNLIKKLHRLEELTIIVDPKDQSWKGIADTIAEEVASLKQLTIRCLPGEASPSVYGTPPEGSPSVNGHGIIGSQPPDCDYDIPRANGEIQEASSSNSMTAAAGVFYLKPKSILVYQTRQVQPSSYIDAFPQCIRPYIKHVKDVSPDGHCGFRSIADLIGRGEDCWVEVKNDLLQELRTYNDLYTNLYGSFKRIEELTHSLTYFDAKAEQKEYWMTMPDMGHLIASCYNIVLYHFSPQQCLTFLPLRSDPLPLIDRKEISIGFVNGNHFVELFMEQGHPVPPIASNWQKYRYSCAAGWESPYDKRITHFKEIVNENVVTKETFEAIDIA